MFESNTKRTFRVEKLTNGYTVSVGAGDFLKDPPKHVAKDKEAVMSIIKQQLP